jgi:hypothetical protein
MAVARLGVLIKVNGLTVPDYAMPDATPGVLYPSATARDQTGRAGGARGWAWCDLTWEEIPIRGLHWWYEQMSDIPVAAPIADIVLPDVRSSQRIEGYEFHRAFSTATLEEPKLDPAGTWGVYKAGRRTGYEMYFEGRVTIRIVEIERAVG